MLKLIDLQRLSVPCARDAQVNDSHPRSLPVYLEGKHEVRRTCTHMTFHFLDVDTFYKPFILVKLSIRIIFATLAHSGSPHFIP